MLAYFSQALKDSPARRVMEGLSGHEENYAEAIECLQKCYDLSRLLHEAHVEAPEGLYRRGMRRLHDHLNQHLTTLYVINY